LFIALQNLARAAAAPANTVFRGFGGIKLFFDCGSDCDDEFFPVINNLVVPQS
jgi:hypothetical protein